MSEDSSDLFNSVKRALGSSKVDPFLYVIFEGLSYSRKETDLLDFPVVLLAKIQPGTPQFDGEIIRNGDTIGLQTTFLQIPKLVDDPGIVYLRSSQLYVLQEILRQKTVARYRNLYYIGTSILIIIAIALSFVAFTEIPLGFWIFPIILVAFTVQMIGLIKSRPKRFH